MFTSRFSEPRLEDLNCKGVILSSDANLFQLAWDRVKLLRGAVSEKKEVRQSRKSGFSEKPSLRDLPES